jgi:hypothetical protein
MSQAESKKKELVSVPAGGLYDPSKGEIIGGTPGKKIERTVDLGDKVEYIYADGTSETKPKGKLPGTGTPLDDKRQEKFNAILGRAQNEVDKVDQAWYTSQRLGKDNGAMTIDEYNRRVKAIKNTYGTMLEPYRKTGLWHGWDESGKAAAPVSTQGTTPSFKSADEVKAAFKANKITQQQAVDILKKDYGMQ